MTVRTERLRALPRVPGAFRVRAAAAADGAALQRLYPDPGKAARFLECGDTCLVAEADGEIQAVEWLRFGPSEYADDARRLGVEFRIPAGACWLHDGRNVHGDGPGPWGILMGTLRGFLERHGVASAFLQVDAAEPYSRACHESLGFRSVGRVAALRLRGAYWVAVRAVPGSWQRRRRGVLDLGAWSA